MMQAIGDLLPTAAEILVKGFWSIVTGVIASYATVRFIEYRKEKREATYYRPLVGRWVVFTLDGTRIASEVLTIEYTGKRVLKVVSYQHGQYAWQSRIVMNESNPLAGEGNYEHSNREEYGAHVITIAPEQDIIRVHFRNHSRYNGAYGGVIWRREPCLHTASEGGAVLGPIT